MLKIATSSAPKFKNHLIPRIYTDQTLATSTSITLPPVAARHIQVLRLQPGGSIALFNGLGEVEGEFGAMVQSMGRSDVTVVVGNFKPTQLETPRTVHLAVGMPANERMDWLVEKATELGVTSIQPLMTERSVLRLSGERLEKKRAHWQGIAIAACEQCGRNRVPLVHAPASLSNWLKILASSNDARLLLSLQAASQSLPKAMGASRNMTFLSGPEGGLSAAEESAALAKGFAPVTLGPRILRSETAPLACLALSMLGESA